MLITLALVFVMAAATWIAGWVGVAIVAVVVGLAYGRAGRRTWSVALAAVVAWAALLLVDAASGRERDLLVLLQGTMQIPGPALLLATLLFPGLLAWSGAATSSALSRMIMFRGVP